MEPKALSEADFFKKIFILLSIFYYLPLFFSKPIEPALSVVFLGAHYLRKCVLQHMVHIYQQEPEITHMEKDLQAAPPGREKYKVE